jgi:hypothetical protein
MAARTAFAVCTVRTAVGFANVNSSSLERAESSAASRREAVFLGRVAALFYRTNVSA